MAIWRRPACSGCSSLVPVTFAARSFARSSSRSTPSEASAEEAAEFASSSAASSRWCDPDRERPGQPRGLLQRGLDGRGAARCLLGARQLGAEGDARPVPGQPLPQPAEHGVGLLLGSPPSLARVDAAGTALSTASADSSRST